MVDNFAAGHYSHTPARREGDSFRVVQWRTRFGVALGTVAAGNSVAD